LKEYLTDLTQIDHVLTRFVFPFAWKTLGAFAVWIVCGFLVRGFQKLLSRALNRKHVDPTLIYYANSTLALLLKGLLLLAILGIFGIETTSFSAILAAAGVAIGVAWSGLLANFAAGIFLIILRPFKVGDVISAAGITGVVREIGLFATSLDNAENLRVFVSNNKLFSDNILNYSANGYRVATLKVQLAHGVEPNAAIGLLASALQGVSDIAPLPKVEGTITELNMIGVVISMRVPCNNSVYTSVVAQCNEVIFRTLKAANYPVPEERTYLVSAGDSPAATPSSTSKLS
jgi:small conductance mechanosensitive channel